MELIKQCWSKKDGEEFIAYLETFSNDTNREWSVNLLKTQLPVLCMKTKPIQDIANEIAKGNYLSFLDLMLWQYYENTAINGMLICKIKDFEVMKKYLDIYSAKADNWATCDLLKFNVSKEEDKYFALAKEYYQNDKPFVRRIGMYFLFYFIDKDEYLDEIFNMLDQFESEEHYYVNMMNAWLLCECFTKKRERTLKYLENNKLNKFTINKGVQKCRDSRRVSIEDKDMLLKYKR